MKFFKFNFDFKFKLPWKRKQGSSGVAYSSVGDATFSDHDSYKFAQETYKENVFAFACIDRIAKAISSVDWDLYIKDKLGEKERVLENPSKAILDRPNPSESFGALMYKAAAYLVISGDSWFHKMGPTTGRNSGMAKELEVLRPDKMKIVVDKDTGVIKGYEYGTGENKIFYPIDPVTMQAEVKQVKLFDPLNDLYGMGPSKPAAREIDSSNDATDWNKALLQNKGQPGMLYIFDDKLSDMQYDRMKQQLHEEYSGPQNAGKNMILEGARDVKPFGLTPAEFDFIESHRETARKIATAYGVPPMLLGIPGDNTYSNYKEARQAFWEDTVTYYLNLFKEELNAWLFPTGDKVFIDYNLDKVPALAPKRQILWENAQKSDFLTINQKLKMVGLEGIGDQGDVVLVQASMIPLDMVGVGLGEEPANEENDEDDKMIDQLLKEGYTEEDACRFLGLAYQDNHV